MKCFLICLLGLSVAFELLAGEPPLQFKVDFKEEKMTQQFARNDLPFIVETDTVIKANSDEWCEKLELLISAESTGQFNFFDAEDKYERPAVTGRAFYDTKITLTEGISQVSTSSSAGYLLQVMEPGFFHHQILIECESPQWKDEKLPEFLEIHLIYSPAIIRVNRGVFTLSPTKFGMYTFKVRLRK